VARRYVGVKVFLDRILLLGAEKQVLSFQFEVDETYLFIVPLELKMVL